MAMNSKRPSVEPKLSPVKQKEITYLVQIVVCMTHVYIFYFMIICERYKMLLPNSSQNVTRTKNILVWPKKYINIFYITEN